MKTIIKFVILLSVLLFATQCLAQFGNTNGTKFPYTNGLSRNDVFLIGTPGVTNKNVAASNILLSISALNTASLPTFTNGSAVIGYNNVFLGSNVVSSPNLISNSFIAANAMGANFADLDECVWIGMKPNSGGMQGPGSIVIGSGAGGYPYSVVIGNQSDCFSYYSESIGVTSGINASTNAINFGYGSAWDSKSSVHVFGSAYADGDVTARTSYYGTKSGIATLPTTTNHIFQGKITADASGLTNIANANVVSAGTGITIVTNTTAGTGTKEYVLTSTGGSATTITNTASDSGILVGGNGSYGVGSANFYKTNSGANKTYTNLFGGKWDNTGTAPIFYVGPNSLTYFNDAAGQNNYVGGILNVANDLIVSGNISGNGSLITSLSISQLAQPGVIHTNGLTVAGTFSNSVTFWQNGVSTTIASNRIDAGTINLTSGSDGSITVGTSAGANKITLSGTAGNAGFAGTIYETNLTASRVILTDANKGHASAAASGAVPIDADGSATTFAQIQTLSPGYFVTNGMSVTPAINGNSITNVKLSSLVSATNTWGSQSVDFSTPEVTTNASGNITFAAALNNFNPTNYNYQTFHVLANGADRTVTKAAGWASTRGTHIVTNGTKADFIISAQIGVFTNMSQIDYVP